MSISDCVSVFIICLFIAGVTWVAVAWYQDKHQTQHSILFNYPVIGRFRYKFEGLRPFLQQYFLNGDDDGVLEQRKCDEVYRNSKNEDNKIAFGSTRKAQAGQVIFHNSLVPINGTEIIDRNLIIGPNAKHPFVVNKVFHISGMSFGALSSPAVSALANGAAIAGVWQNTGEGGVSEYHISKDSRLIYQIGTANYGVRDENGMLSESKLKEVGEKSYIAAFEIKLSQGAKPGLGGILPGSKVTPEIAVIRGIEVGKTSYSPAHNPEITCVKDIPYFLAKVRRITGKPVGLKMAITSIVSFNELLDACQAAQEGDASVGVGFYPDFITIDGGDGGTGAAPVAFMESVALPLQFVLPDVVNSLKSRNLYGDIKVVASGKLITSTDVAWALAVGAHFAVSARGPMLSMGCIRALHCASNTCPTGITTHDKKIHKGFNVENKGVRVGNYLVNMEKELHQLAKACGVEHPWDFRRMHASMIMNEHQAITLTELYDNQKSEPVSVTNIQGKSDKVA